jgi:agarase
MRIVRRGKSLKRRRTGFIAVLLIALVKLVHAADMGAAGDYLGCGPADLGATGFFRVEEVDGRWWFVTPDGRRFISKGINHIRYDGYYCPALGYSPYERAVKELYGSTEGWAEATRERLIDWGFNTVGSWSNWEELQPMPYTLNLNLARLGGANWRTGEFLDVFDPAWEEAAKEHCKKICGPLKEDPYLIGYFTDNELHWGPDWRGFETMLDIYMAMPESSPGHRAAKDFKKEHEGSRREAELEFARVVARKYFEVTSNAIREADPNHLVLGCRFHALGVPSGVIEEAGRYFDVVSINFYDMLPRLVTAISELFGNVPMATDWMAEYARLSGKPVLLTEFSYRAMDSGMPNTQGAGSVVITQKQRAGRFERYAMESLSTPYIIGYHWFNYMDEPWLGRSDGENGNYGVVDGKDRPYQTMVERMEKINERSCELHR